VLLSVPFSRRPWALPSLFRLYRNKKECIKKRQRYRKKTELGREMLDVFRSWTGDRRIELAADAACLRVFFCTAPNLSVVQILEAYAGRWAIESCFRNLKQLMGFADSQARKRAAVELVAPFVALSYTFLILWFIEHAFRRSFTVVPLRSWYRHKEGFSFADVLRTAQRVLAPLDVLGPRRNLHNLRQSRAPVWLPSSAQQLCIIH
jgi:hypothetical protein